MEWNGKESKLTAGEWVKGRTKMKHETKFPVTRRSGEHKYKRVCMHEYVCVDVCV